MKISYYALILSAGLLSMSCGGDSDDAMETNPPPPASEVTYTTNVKPIIDSNCLGCHGSTPTNGAPVSLTTYTLVKDATETKNLIGRIENGSMPPSGSLSSSQIQTIKNWKTEGYKQ